MAEKQSPDSSQLFGNLDKAQKYPLPQGFETCLGINIVRMSKQMQVAGTIVNIALQPEFQSFSKDEMERFSSGWKDHKVVIEHLHDGELYKKELAEKKSAKPKKATEAEPTV